MGILSGSAAPVVAPNPEAVHEEQVVTAVDVSGQAVTYQGPALHWDPAKARTIALGFSAPWYARRTVELFVWSAADAQVLVSSPVLASDQAISLKGGSLPSGGKLSIDIPDGGDGLVMEVRLYLTLRSPPADAVYIGLDGGKPGTSTAMQWRVVPNLSFGVLAASWAMVFLLLFALGLQTGTKGALYAAPAIALIPTILKTLGASWAQTFDVSRLALRIARSQRPILARIWVLLGVPAALVMTYVVIALATFGVYYYGLHSRGLSERVDIEKAASLFCDYPERIEVRALLARSIHASSTFGRANAYGEVTRLIPVSTFLDKCLSGWRVTPFFYDPVPGRLDDARVFYASLWWDAIGSDLDFAPAMDAIHEVLAGSLAPSRLAALTLAKYQLRSVKNQNEQEYCRREKAASDDCAIRKRQCAALRKELVRLLQHKWTPLEKQTVTYLESQDVAASSYMSPGCAPEGPKDVESAVSHLWALVKGIPRQEVVLDDLLLQINFRKYLDSQLEKRPAHSTSLEWQDECQQYQPQVCKLLHETFINDLKQTFFTPDREKRAAEWEAPSIPALKGALLEQRIEELSKKGWKWPL